MYAALAWTHARMGIPLWRRVAMKSGVLGTPELKHRQYLRSSELCGTTHRRPSQYSGRYGLRLVLTLRVVGFILGVFTLFLLHIMQKTLVVLALCTLALQASTIFFCLLVVYPAVRDLEEVLPEVRAVASNESLSVMMAHAVDSKVFAVLNSLKMIEKEVGDVASNLTEEIDLGLSASEANAKLLMTLMEASTIQIENSTENLEKVVETETHEITSEVRATKESSDSSLRQITGKLTDIENKLG
jgi:hypothetical protein